MALPERRELGKDEIEVDKSIGDSSAFLVYCHNCKKMLYRPQENTMVTRAVSLNVMHSHSASFHPQHHVTRYTKDDKIG